MFAQSIPSMPTAASMPLSRPEPAAPSEGFGEILSRQVGAPANVDPVDEDKALKELFHLLAMLSLGQVDGSVFSESDLAPGTPAGPVRAEVETLKRAIRHLMGGGRAEDSVQDSDATSLGALFQSLPTEIQDLLRRAFPDVDRILAEEVQKGLVNRAH